MKWYFRVATGVGLTLALAGLLTQVAPRIGLFGQGPMRSVQSSAQVAVANGSGDSFSWSDRLPEGQTIEIKGVNGSVTAEPASGSEVEVVAVKRSRRSDPGSVRIEVVRHANGVTVCAVYPGPRNSCGPGDGGHMNTNNNDVQVQFTVRVPEGVRLAAHTVNGGVKAAELRSDLEATTVNGSIDIVTTGLAEANTVNGSINATIGGLALRSDLDFNTVNGSITVTIPDGLNAAVDAASLSGRLTNDFGIRVNRRQMQGVLGSGGYELSLNTVNGSIQLRRGN